MTTLDETTLFEEYMADTTDDVGAIKFIKSPQCTLAMVNYDSGDGWCALNLAARLNRFDVVQALVDKGANVNHVSWDTSFNPLMYCIYEGSSYSKDEQDRREKTVTLLIQAGTNLNFEDRFSAFTLACQTNSTSIIKDLLEHSINLHFKDENGKTGLDYLIENNNDEAISLVQALLIKEKTEVVPTSKFKFL